MIEIKYYNHENGQEMTVNIAPSGDEGVSLNFSLDPPATKETEDPYGVMARLLHLFSGNGNIDG